jgi:hypothetical protein
LVQIGQQPPCLGVPTLLGPLDDLVDSPLRPGLLGPLPALSAPFEPHVPLDELHFLFIAGLERPDGTPAPLFIERSVLAGKYILG